MPTAEDGALTGLYTSQHGSLAVDPYPNQPPTAGPAETSFDLHLSAVAGADLGGSGAPYTLTIQVIDQTAPGTTPPASLSPGVITNQTFDGTGPNWAPSGAQFVSNQTFTIPPSGSLPAGLSGHNFVYTASLVSHNNVQVWSIVGEPFTLC
jgi:hypothetical protein